MNIFTDRKIADAAKKCRLPITADNAYAEFSDGFDDRMNGLITSRRRMRNFANVFRRIMLSGVGVMAMFLVVGIYILITPQNGQNTEFASKLPDKEILCDIESNQDNENITSPYFDILFIEMLMQLKTVYGETATFEVKLPTYFPNGMEYQKTDRINSKYMADDEETLVYSIYLVTYTIPSDVPLSCGSMVWHLQYIQSYDHYISTNWRNVSPGFKGSEVQTFMIADVEVNYSVHCSEKSYDDDTTMRHTINWIQGNVLYEIFTNLLSMELDDLLAIVESIIIQ
jgi:hypothetical protein